MCGICGICGISLEKGSISNDIERMVAVSKHETDKLWIASSNKEQIALLQHDSTERKLINDNVTLLYEGEIYNLDELISLLASHGKNYKSDSELIYNLFVEYGEKCFRLLRGVFALCIFDKKKHRIFLVRDKLGVKPLFYCLIKDKLVFASEMKAILQCSDIRKEIDSYSLQKYLFYGYVPSPNTILRNIYKVLAGHYLIFDQDGLRSIKYWDLDFSEKYYFETSKAVEAIEKELMTSIKRRLKDDAKFGIALSGGLDSSVLTALVSKLVPSFKTFTIKFEDKRIDESDYSFTVARQFNTDHYSVPVSLQDLTAIANNIADILDEPMADPSILPTYALYNFAKAHVGMLLTGDGGDEAFGGYPKYIGHIMAERYKRIPRLLRGSLLNYSVKKILKARYNDLVTESKMDKFFKDLECPVYIRNQIWISQFHPSELQFILQNKVEYDIFEDVHLHDGIRYKDPVDTALYLDIKINMVDAYNVKADRASRSNLLPARFPYLDENLFELSAGLPSRLKVKSFTTKVILRHLAKKYLPEEISSRSKKGFGLPLSDLIEKELSPSLSHLAEEKTQKVVLLNHQYVKELLNEHYSGRKDNSGRIWTLFVLQKWIDKWLTNE